MNIDNPTNLLSQKYTNASNANTITIQSGVTSASYTLTLPTAVAAVTGYFLSSTDAGVLSWAAGGAGGGADTALSNLASVQINTNLIFADDNVPTTYSIGIDAQATAATTGNALNIYAGSGGSSTGYGGDLTISAGQAGTGADGDGGYLYLYGGQGGNTNGGWGGDVRILAGKGGNGGGNGGDLRFQAGNGGTTDGSGGDAYFSGGDATATNGDGGHVTLTAGIKQGSGSYGTISFSTEDSLYGFSGNISQGILNFANINTTDKTFTFPNASGTIALTSDIPTISFGTDNQVPFTNAGGNGFDYSAGFTFDGTNLNLLTNQTFTKELNHEIKVADSTTGNTDGGNLTIRSGHKTGSGERGRLILYGGDEAKLYFTDSFSQISSPSSELIGLKNSTNNFNAFMDLGTISADRTFTFPNLTGTFALTGVSHTVSFGATTVSSLLASTNDSGAIGASGTAFSDLFLASGAVINWDSGNATLTHSAALLTSNVDIAVPDEAYGSGWNGSLEVPTKNAVYDKIEDGVILTTTVSLSAANIIAMYTTPITGVAGVAGKVPVLVSVLWSFTYNSVQFTGGGTCRIIEETTATALTASGVPTAAQINGTANIIRGTVSIDPTTRTSGKGLMITNITGAFATGNSTMKVTLAYYWVTI